MISETTIKEVVNDIVKRIKPHKVILFGSYARGNPTSDSDIDILVVVSMRGSATEKVRRVRSAITRNGFGLDVVVRTPRQVQKSLNGRDWFIQEIFEQGKVLYARRN